MAIQESLLCDGSNGLQARNVWASQREGLVPHDSDNRRSDSQTELRAPSEGAPVLSLSSVERACLTQTPVPPDLHNKRASTLAGFPRLVYVHRPRRPYENRES